MNILLYKFHSYLSRQPESSQLNRVIVVEEAHNVFKRTLSEENGRALSNEYFDKMLAEIRSSGTGLLLSDQRASLLSEAVMANTSVKILHALTDSEDRKTVGASANLSDFQLKKLAEFRPGECVVAIRGQHGVQHAQVTAPAGEQELHSACHICTTRFRCRRNAVKSMLAGMDSTRIAFHVSKIQAEPYNVALLERNITNMLRDLNVTASDATKICLLGKILDTYGRSSLQEKRIIVNLAQYAIAGYEVDALDYILKPINYFSFKLKIQKALETVRRVQGTLLTIASDHGQQLVRDSEIFYIEVQGHNLIYHTLHGDLTATGTLKQIEAQLKPSGFYRCNYCYLVNLRHVGFLDGSEVTVGQYKLQISRNRRKEFLQQLTQFYGRGGR